MNILHSILSHYWAIPFSLPLLIRNRLALAAVSAGMTPLLVGLNLGSDARFATGFLLALGIAISLALGRGTSAVLIGLSSRARTRAIAALAAIWGILVLPGAMASVFASLAHATTLKIRHWEARTPPPACLARTYPVKVAGVVYHLPAASVITVRTRGKSYHFQYSRSLRSACGRASKTSVPVRATNVNLDFSIPERKAFCTTTTDTWARRRCKDGAQQARYPDMVNIYAPAEYDRQHLMPPPAYTRFMDWQRKARAAGHRFVPEADGIFDHYVDGYWVARGDAWKNTAGEPYTLHCDDTSTPDILSCDTSYNLESGLTLSYRFTAPRRALAKTARWVDDGLHAMLEEFARPRPAKPLATHPKRR